MTTEYVDMMVTLRNIVIVFFTVIAFTEAACDGDVTISNAQWQTSREGTYQRQDESCEGRPIYRQKGGESYIFFLVTHNGWSGWMIGTNACTNIGGIAAAQDAPTPDLVVDGTWEEVYNGNWYYSSELKVECKDGLSTGAIAGIAVSCLVFVLVICVIIGCCCCKDTKHSNTVSASSVSHISSSGPGMTSPSRPWIQPHVHYNQGGPNPGSRGHYLGPSSAPRSTAGFYGNNVQGPNSQVHGLAPPPAYSADPPAGATTAGVYPGGSAGPTEGVSASAAGSTQAAPGYHTSYPSEPPPVYSYEDKYPAVSD